MSDARSLGDELLAVRVAKNEHAAEGRCRFDCPLLLKLRHKLLVVRRIVVPSRVARRTDAGRTVQDLDLKSRIVGKARASRLLRIKASLEPRVAQESVRVFDRLGQIAEILERQKLHGELLKCCENLFDLPFVLRSDYDLLHPILPTFQTSSPPSASFCLAINSSTPFSASARRAAISLREKGRPSPVPCTSTKS